MVNRFVINILSFVADQWSSVRSFNVKSKFRFNVCRQYDHSKIPDFNVLMIVVLSEAQPECIALFVVYCGMETQAPILLEQIPNQ